MKTLSALFFCALLASCSSSTDSGGNNNNNNSTWTGDWFQKGATVSGHLRITATNATGWDYSAFSKDSILKNSTAFSANGNSLTITFPQGTTTEVLHLNYVNGALSGTDSIGVLQEVRSVSFSR